MKCLHTHPWRTDSPQEQKNFENTRGRSALLQAKVRVLQLQVGENHLWLLPALRAQLDLLQHLSTK
jgi:hypothetical protein